MRVGIPRALHTFHHYPLWHRFVTELGAEVRLSPPTDREILAAGVALAPAETCLPVKAYLGHVAWLRDKCDSVMIPRLVCVMRRGRPRFGCPKAIALPDLIRATVPDLPPILELVQDERATKMAASFLHFGRHFNPDHKGKIALTRAVADQKKVTELLRSGMPVSGIWSEEEVGRIGRIGPMGRDEPQTMSSLRIGVIGHSYLLFDSLLSLGLPDKLRSMGIDARYPLATPEDAVFPEPTRNREVSWLYEQELLGAAWYFMKGKGRGTIDGLLLVSSFACGTSAVINEIINRELLQPGLPMLTLLLDEHTAESGVATRLEAFADMVRHYRK